MTSSLPMILLSVCINFLEDDDNDEGREQKRVEHNATTNADALCEPEWCHD